MQFFNHAEGYVTPSGSSFKYVHQYKDHLGNIRLSYSDLNGDGDIDVTTDPLTTEIIEENNYYPFGLKHKGYNTGVGAGGNSVAQKRKFQGQDIDDELGLNWYGFKYRNYDPTIGRFIQIDPLSERFAHQSHYNFAENEVIRGYEFEGLEKVNANDGQRAKKDTRGSYEASVKTREIGFGLRHPIIASKIGAGVSSGSADISTNSTRFATRGEVLFGSKRPQEDRGSENGAFRHVLWQATMTSQFGESAAKQVGAAHEQNPEADLNQRTFDDIDAADETVDLLNNEIGREIGTEFKGSGMLKLAFETLHRAGTDGFFTATKGKDGKFHVSKGKLSFKKYLALVKVFSKLNDNGRTKEEQKKADKREDAAKTLGNSMY